MKMISFFVFLSHGAQVEWNWRGKPEVLGEKPVPLPLCPPEIPYGLTRDRTRASAVRGRRLSAWDMVRPKNLGLVLLQGCESEWYVDEDSLHNAIWRPPRMSGLMKRASGLPNAIWRPPRMSGLMKRASGLHNAIWRPPRMSGLMKRASGLHNSIWLPPRISALIKMASGLNISILRPPRLWGRMIKGSGGPNAICRAPPVCRGWWKGRPGCITPFGDPRYVRADEKGVRVA
jgi:hypothetical protein